MTEPMIPELKSERVQQEAMAPLRRRVARPGDAVGNAMSKSGAQASERLKAERVQLRLQRIRGWKMQPEGKAIDRVRQFPDPLVAASYLAFAGLLARQTGQPLRASVYGKTIILALTGRAKGAEKGITEEVLDLAEQLG